MTTTVLLHARNRRGLGHLMRAQNLASAIRDGHDATPHVHATHRPDPRLWDPTLALTVDGERPLDDVLAEVRPDVVVHDTTLPAGGSTRWERPAVLVMRRRVSAEHDALLADPRLAAVDCIVVPHDEAEFGLPLPADLRARTHFVGPIARRPDDTSVARIRRAAGTQRGARLVTATVGGGGFAEQADRFFEIVARCVPKMVDVDPLLRIVVVLGPNYRNESMTERLSQLPNTEVRDTETRLVDLVAASDLVIAEGGYNTVTEVRIAAVPAVFVPSCRRLDDQHERVTRVATTGAAVVCLPTDDATVIAGRLAALVADHDALAAMRQAAAQHRIELGNDRAAAAIVAVAR
jgi:predicted glycosyltransferase